MTVSNMNVDTTHTRTDQDYEDMKLAFQILDREQARVIRKACALTLHKMSELVGTSHVTIARWEHGTRTPRAGLAITYGRVLRSLIQNPGSAGRVQNVSISSSGELIMHE